MRELQAAALGLLLVDAAVAAALLYRLWRSGH
jgi:hypothetical protein